MTGKTFPATPYLRRLTAANGWRGVLVRDHHGRVDAIVAVRIGSTWTDAVAIAGEDQTVAMRYRTDPDQLIAPAALPSDSRAVWQWHGRGQPVAPPDARSVRPACCPGLGCLHDTERSIGEGQRV